MASLERQQRISWREQRRQARSLAHRRARLRRRLSKGQTLIIFALSITVLLGIAGLAVDVARAYDLYARMQRAAEAGALAASLYMPNNYATPVPAPGDNKTAISRASEEVVKNGFAAVLPTTLSSTYFGCPNAPTTFELTVCPVTGKPDDVRVTVNETLSLVLMGNLGLQPITLSASAEAEYLPPVEIGSRTSYFGDQVECVAGTSSQYCDIGAAGSHLQYFLATMDGPAELKESGDPMVYCGEGPAESATLDANVSLTTYNGNGTNHPQWPGVTTGPITQYCGKPVAGGKTGNPDYQPDGYDGPMTHNTAHPGGYNYEISIAPGIPHASVWIYNANYVPLDSSSTPPPLDHFIYDGTGNPNFYQGPVGEGIGNRYDGHHDAPLFFYNVTYSIYAVGNQYDRTSDTLVTSQTFAPYDATTSDLQKHSCTVGTTTFASAASLPAQVYNPYYNGAATANTYHNPGGIQPSSGCVTPPSCMLRWCKISPTGGLSPGLYRLVVEASGLNANDAPDYVSSSTDGWGQHSYAIKACDTDIAATSSPVGSACGNGSGQTGGQFNSAPLAVFGWNNMDLTFQATMTTQLYDATNPQTQCIQQAGTPANKYSCLDIGCIPANYSGRTLTLKLFDIGDGGGSGRMYVGVVPPPSSNATVTYPSSATLYTVDGEQAVVVKDASNNHPYNGLWLDVTIQLPATYTGDCTKTGAGSGWWQVIYAADTTAQPDDKLAVSFTLVGSPVHLVPVALG